MASTRLASPRTTLGFDPADRRDRVDPVKLLDLIQRIKGAGGGRKPVLAPTQTKAPAKAG